jgi:uncharacterized protein (DUF983 family)
MLMPSGEKHRRSARHSGRSTDSRLDLPTGRRVLAIASRVLLLRCPNCGRGPVLTRRAAVHDHCSGCGLRFRRSDDNYFSGAMFFGLLIGETIFAVSLLAAIVASWPNVPWDAITYIAPIGMIVVMVLLIPVSKVVWLGVDLLARPATPAELGGAGR